MFNSSLTQMFRRARADQEGMRSLRQEGHPPFFLWFDLPSFVRVERQHSKQTRRTVKRRLRDRRRSSLRFETLDKRELLAGIINVRLDAVNLSGDSVSTITAGDSFALRGYVRDQRADASGVFASYLDVTYDSSKVAVNGGVTFGASFPSGRSANTSTAGLIDEVGGFANLGTPPGGGELLLFEIPMIATSGGSVTFASNVADDSPAHQTLTFGNAASTGSVSVTGSQWQNAALPRDTNNDGSVSPIDALIVVNDLNNNGARALTTESTLVDVNGDLSVSPQDVLFIVDELNGFASDAPVDSTNINFGSVNLTVTSDASAKDDTYDALGNVGIAVDAAHGLLANDLGATMITAFDSSSSAGGSIFGVDTETGAFSYRPPVGFRGLDTFEYTITDGTTTDVGSVTINVADMIWFVDDSADEGGDGRLGTPFDALTPRRGAHCR